MKSIDLHMHSNYSDDGSYTPSTLISMCKENGLEYIALSDHNSVKGVAEMIEAGKSNGIYVIPGIEIDCVHNGINLHILAYNIDYNNPIYQTLEDNIMNQEREAAELRMRKVEDLGIYINRDKIHDLSFNGVVTGEAIAEASLYEPENDRLELLKPYLEGGSRSDNPFVNFYWDFCAQGKSAYIPIHFPSLAEIAKIVKDDGGDLVFAHPGNNIPSDVNILQSIMDEGVMGIECFSSYHSDEQTKFFYEYAKDNQYLVTCGSDFHGKIKPNIRYGELNIKEEDGQAILEQLFKK